MVKKEDCRVKNAREGKAIYVPGKSLEEMEAEEAERQTRLSCRLVDLTDAEWSMIDTAIPDVLELLNDVRNVFDDIAYMDGLDRPGVNSMLRLAGDHQRPEPGPCLWGFKAIYSTAYLAAPSQAAKIAMTVPSSARDESYGWLGQFPQLREWLDGERVVRQLKAMASPS